MNELIDQHHLYSHFLSQFSETPTDVLQHHWDLNGRPQPPPIGGSLLTSLPSRRPGCRDYPICYQKLLEIARDHLLGWMLLEYGFPLHEEMHSQATECFDEAISTYPGRYPSLPLDRDFRTSK